MNISKLAILSLVALIMGACSDNKKFTVEGEVEGSPNMNLYIKYMASDAMRTGVTLVRDGHFEFEGHASAPTLLEIYDNENRPLARAYVQNGDKLKMLVNRGNVLKMNATGNEVNDRLSSAMALMADAAVADSAANLNPAIEAYIDENPDDIVAAILFATLYNAKENPARADSIIESIEASIDGAAPLLAGMYTAISHYGHADSYGKIDSIAYRPTYADTVLYFIPKKHKNGSLLVITNDKCGRNDSIVEKLKQIKRDHAKLEIMEITLTPDTGTWKRITRRDTATWTQGWAPGQLFARGIYDLAIPQIPYYIAIDTAGNQTYRGNSLAKSIETKNKDKK